MRLFSDGITLHNCSSYTGAVIDTVILGAVIGTVILGAVFGTVIFIHRTRLSINKDDSLCFTSFNNLKV